MIVIMTEGRNGNVNWHLSAYGRHFELGEGLEFCKDFLGLTNSELVEELGITTNGTGTDRKAIARFIVDRCGLTRQNVTEFKFKKLPVHKRR